MKTKRTEPPRGPFGLHSDWLVAAAIGMLIGGAIVALIFAADAYRKIYPPVRGEPSRLAGERVEAIDAWLGVELPGAVVWRRRPGGTEVKVRRGALSAAQTVELCRGLLERGYGDGATGLVLELVPSEQ